MDPDAIFPQGSFTSHPILLHDVTISELEQFLWVFYNPRLSIYDNTLENWDKIVRLAVLWGFENVLALAHREIDKLQEPLFLALTARTFVNEDPQEEAI